MDLVQGRSIWGLSRIPDREKTRLEFPGLVRFKGNWYCSLRECETHNHHPSGRARIIRSPDGENWETVKLIEWDSGSVAAYLSVTPEKHLMAAAGVYYVSKQPRARQRESKPSPADSSNPPEARDAADRPDLHYQLDWIGTVLNMPHDDLEHHVTHQCFTFTSSDGVRWGTACACPELINTQAYSVSWHNGMGYRIGQWGKDTPGTLYRTRDGKSWRVLKDRFFPKGHGGEGALAFAGDNTAYCLLRGDNSKKVFIGKSDARLIISAGNGRCPAWITDRSMAARVQRRRFCASASAAQA